MKREAEYSSAKLVRDIMADGRAIGLPEGVAKLIAEKTAAHVETWVKGRGRVTNDDIGRVAAKKLRELNADLAYVYENRGRII